MRYFDSCSATLFDVYLRSIIALIQMLSYAVLQMAEQMPKDNKRLLEILAAMLFSCQTTCNLAFFLGASKSFRAEFRRFIRLTSPERVKSPPQETNLVDSGLPVRRVAPENLTVESLEAQTPHFTYSYL